MPQRLGQHFLINQHALRTIVAALDIQIGDLIFEIGPGHGEITARLRAANPEGRIVAIEKDEKLAAALRKRFDGTNVEIITGDILKLLPKLHHYTLNALRYTLTGNIPYYLTGYLLRLLGEATVKPARAVLTIQREVADRLLAAPPRMNLLAASIGVWAVPRRVQNLHARDFSPPPRVDSATIALTTREKPLDDDLPRYYRFIRALFRWPRKTIWNNLKGNFAGGPDALASILKKSSLSGRERPQDLSLEILVRLSRVFEVNS